MITLIEALNYRCLRYVRQPLKEFHVLVGPNASGKTTFFDIISFLGKMVSEGFDSAVKERAWDLRDLIWDRGSKDNNGFELAVEAKIPQEIKNQIEKGKYDCIRCEISARLTPSIDDSLHFTEKVILKKTNSHSTGAPGKRERKKFPSATGTPDSILSKVDDQSPQRVIIDRTAGGSFKASPEISDKSQDKPFVFTLDNNQSALKEFAGDESKFPAVAWFKRYLAKGIQPVILDSQKMRRPSPPAASGQKLAFNTDGSNLPWLIDELRTDHNENFQDWLGHIRTELEDIEDIETVHDTGKGGCYVQVCYKNGLKVPSWTTSDGTLRLLALTILAYIPGLTGIYLVEEPENGIHPSGIETVYQSLSSVYKAQILLATHSPLIVSLVEAEDILCFAKTPDGETDIIAGIDHPNMNIWKDGIDLGTLFASGVLK